MLILGVPMLMLGALMWTRSGAAQASGFILFLFGLVCVTAGLLSIISPAELSVGPEGLVLKDSLRTRTFGWGQAANFRLVQLRRTTLIGFDRPGAQSMMSDVASALRTVAVPTSYDAVLPGRWKDAPVETVVETLNGARAKWGGLDAAHAPMLRPRHATGQRIDRKVYWIAAGGLLLVGGVIAVLTHGARITGYGTLAMWIWLIARRLHDIGRSGWWQAAVYFVEFLLAAVLIGSHLGAGVAIGAIGLVHLAFIVGLGTIPGDPGENRFGPPPGVHEPEVLAEAFS